MDSCEIGQSHVRPGGVPRAASLTEVTFNRVGNFGQGRTTMSRMSWPMMAAFVVMAVIALMLLSGPWSPRMVEKDPAGMVVGGPPRPLPPGTPITTVPETTR